MNELLSSLSSQTRRLDHNPSGRRPNGNATPPTATRPGSPIGGHSPSSSRSHDARQHCQPPRRTTPTRHALPSAIHHVPCFNYRLFPAQLPPNPSHHLADCTPSLCHNWHIEFCITQSAQFRDRCRNAQHCVHRGRHASFGWRPTTNHNALIDTNATFAATPRTWTTSSVAQKALANHNHNASNDGYFFV